MSKLRIAQKLEAINDMGYMDNNIDCSDKLTLKVKMVEILKLCRVKQWIKNSFVFAAVIFSGNLLNLEAIMLSISAFILFSLTSSLIYIINDIVDVEEDRKHPKKRFRPIAKGTVSINQAKVLAFLLFSVIAIFSAVFNIILCLILLIYFSVNLLYSFKLKKVMILDVMTIASGFILRILAGGVAIDVIISNWLIICTGLLSLYLGFGKRKNELLVLAGDASEHRETLSQYTLEYLDRILLVILGLTVMTYILYTINGSEYKGMIFTIPFVLYGTFRYEHLIVNKGAGGSPEDVFMEDKPFLINILLWVVVCISSIYFG
jgi:4-hydroxybenzoate polyprenyltransferase